MKKRPYFSLLLLSAIALVAMQLGCNKGASEITIDTTPYNLYVPEGFAMPNIPEDNQMTKARVAMGKALFFDKRLSRDSTIACSSCHQPDRGYADIVALSPGVKGRVGFRNSPTLTNVAYHPYFFREGGNPTLEQQAIGPIENPDEMDMTLPEVIARLAHSEYNEMSLKAYGRTLDVFSLTRAIAAYERTLIGGDSRYDAYRRGDTTAMSEAEVAGMELFFSAKTQCSSCHTGNDFSDYAFLHNGLQSDYTADLGLARRTTLPEDVGKFKLPTLRNIALTAPYMHDGRLASLQEVVAHYNSGGMEHPNKDARIKPLNLTQTEQANLVLFLKALTDTKLGPY